MTTDISWDEYEMAFGFLATILNTPPDVALVSQLRDASRYPAKRGSGHGGNETMRRHFHRHEGTPLEKMVQELAVDWTRLFRGLSPKCGPPPPYEGVYCEKDGIGIQTLLEIKQAYLNHGLSLPEGKTNREDYLGYELDFVRHLAAKADAAQEHRKKEEEAYYTTMVYEFLHTHLFWVSDFCRTAADHATTEFYDGFLKLLHDTVAEAAADSRFREVDIHQ